MMIFQSFTQMIGIDVPPEQECELFAEVRTRVRSIIGVERFVVQTTVVDIIANGNILVLRRTRCYGVGQYYLFRLVSSVLLRKSLLGCLPLLAANKFRPVGHPVSEKLTVRRGQLPDIRTNKIQVRFLLDDFGL